MSNNHNDTLYTQFDGRYGIEPGLVGCVALRRVALVRVKIMQTAKGCRKVGKVGGFGYVIIGN